MDDPLDEDQSAPSTRMRTKYVSRPGSEPSADLVEAENVQHIRDERDQFRDIAQRARADLDNYRRRVKREEETQKKRQLANVIQVFTQPLDHARLAMQSDPDGDAAMIYGELIETLHRLGIEVFDPEGEQFNPQCHDALTTRLDASVIPGTIIEVTGQGYRIDDIIIRPARVIVSE